MEEGLKAMKNLKQFWLDLGLNLLGGRCKDLKGLEGGFENLRDLMYLELDFQCNKLGEG